MTTPPAYRQPGAGNSILMNYQYQTESLMAMERICSPHPSVAQVEMTIGVRENEPMMVIADSWLRYAKAYRKRFGSPLINEPFIGAKALESIEALRAMCDLQGGVAMERGSARDSKDNGVVQVILDLAVAAIKGTGR